MELYLHSHIRHHSVRTVNCTFQYNLSIRFSSFAATNVILSAPPSQLRTLLINMKSNWSRGLTLTSRKLVYPSSNKYSFSEYKNTVSPLSCPRTRADLSHVPAALAGKSVGSLRVQGRDKR